VDWPLVGVLVMEVLVVVSFENNKDENAAFAFNAF